MIDKKTDKKLNRVRKETPSLQIGKRGITDNFLKELGNQLKREKIIKVKILKNTYFDSRSKAFEELKERLSNDIEILEVRGWTAILAKKD